MKLLKILLYIFIGILLMLACSNCNSQTKSRTDKSNNGTVEINVLKAAEDEREFPLSNIVKDVEFVQLESTIDSYFSLITSYIVTDHFILIATQVEKRVLLFERSGKFLRQIGRQGQGPGEYLNPCFATIDPSERFIIVKDAQGGNLFKFDLNGNIIKQVDIRSIIPTGPNCQPIFVDDNHFALSFIRPWIPVDDYHAVAEFDLELNLVKQMIHKPNNDSLCLTNLSGQKLQNGSGDCYSNLQIPLSSVLVDLD